MTFERSDAADFALHHSVVQRWWLRHLPDAESAVRFLDEQVIDRRVRLFAPDSLRATVCAEIGRDLARDLTLNLARMLSADVAATIENMSRTGVLELVSIGTFLAAAMVNTAQGGLLFEDALAISLAQESGWPLLLADRPLYERLQREPLLGPPLRLAWLPEIFAGP